MAEEATLGIAVGVTSGVATALLVDLIRSVLKWRRRPRMAVALNPRGSAVELVIKNDGREPARGIVGAVDLPATFSVLGSKHSPLGDLDLKGEAYRTWRFADGITVVPGPSVPVLVEFASSTPRGSHECRVRLWSENAKLFTKEIRFDIS